MFPVEKMPSIRTTKLTALPTARSTADPDLLLWCNSKAHVLQDRIKLRSIFASEVRNDYRTAGGGPVCGRLGALCV